MSHNPDNRVLAARKHVFNGQTPTIAFIRERDEDGGRPPRTADVPRLFGNEDCALKQHLKV